ncbi:MAG: septal ring lytic transglycosylase RlpA family protein [Victivallaceae bacterium]|nr:septal ring lytic transglycosylase RlpA family protein [Victivallaceae bacterium]
MKIKKNILLGGSWFCSKLWLMLSKLYNATAWLWGYATPRCAALWLKLGRNNHPVWRFFDRCFKIIALFIVIPLSKIIGSAKQLLDRSAKARAIFFIATPLIIILFLWPPWDWGRWYACQNGVASYYGRGFYFNHTANGELFLPGPFFTAAHKTLPFGTKVLVIDQKTGSSVVVIINDRGPYVGKRIIDLSVAAALRLGIYNRGIAKVTLYTRKPGSQRIFYYPFR